MRARTTGPTHNNYSGRAHTSKLGSTALALLRSQWKKEVSFLMPAAPTPARLFPDKEICFLQPPTPSP